jgi:hypothetical protein
VRSVRYEVRGPLHDVLICHYEECRRWHGHVCAAAAARKADLVLLEKRGLRWIKSPNSDAGARRGFCGRHSVPHPARRHKAASTSESMSEVETEF